MSPLIGTANRPRSAAQCILRGVSCVCVLAGIGALAYVAYTLTSTYIYQAAATPTLEHASRRTTLPAPGAIIGQLQIPRLGLRAVVAEGDSSHVLRRAVGHVPETALPGQVGNVALAGHRDTLFRPLRHIRRGDIILITTDAGLYRYEVQSTQIVSPRNIEILRPTGGHELTLITCFPFDYIGPAPTRFIVRAHALGEGATAGPDLRSRNTDREQS